jgi:hypothetical protein
MTTHNGARGTTVFWIWATVAVAAVLFAGFVYTVFVDSLFI